MFPALALAALSALAILAAWTLMLSGFGRSEPGAAGRGAPTPVAEHAPDAARQDDSASGEPATPGTMGMGEFKQLVQAGEWRRVLPSLLLIGGMLGVMFFGAIALLFLLEQKVSGVLMLLVPIGAAAKLAWDFRNA